MLLISAVTISSYGQGRTPVRRAPAVAHLVELDSLKPNLNLILLGCALAIGGCDRERAAPTGQVVATVNGQEITLEDLNAETGAIGPAGDPGARKAVEQAALQQIVARTIVADHAKGQKLDQTPLAAILRRRAEQEALAGLVQRKLTADVPPPSREEAELFIRDHPASFAQRRVFVVDQITASDLPLSLLRALEGFTTLAEVRQAYAKAGVKYAQTLGTIDALAIDAAAAEKLADLPVGTMFISPEGKLVRVNRVREVATSPVTGDDATRIARATILNGRAAALTQRQLAAIVEKGMAGVRYNAAFEPAQRASAKTGGGR